MSDSILLTNEFGATLPLPYPEGFDNSINYKILSNTFPEVKNNTKALLYLFSYNNFVIEDGDLVELLVSSPGDVLSDLFKNEAFNNRRQLVNSVFVNPVGKYGDFLKESCGKNVESLLNLTKLFAGN